MKHPLYWEARCLFHSGEDHILLIKHLQIHENLIPDTWVYDIMLTWQWEFNPFQMRIQCWRTRRTPPCLKISLGFYFCQFDGLIHIYFDCLSQRAISLQNVFHSLHLLNDVGYVWRGIKTIPRPHEFYCVGTAPPGLKSLRSAIALVTKWHTTCNSSL